MTTLAGPETRESLFFYLIILPDIFNSLLHIKIGELFSIHLLQEYGLTFNDLILVGKLCRPQQKIKQRQKSNKRKQGSKESKNKPARHRLLPLRNLRPCNPPASY